MVLCIYGTANAGENSPLQSQPARPNWHEKAFFGLHYDLHPNAQDTELGAACTEEHIRQELEKVKPDFVTYDCKGHPGYAGYPTKVGTPSPGIVKDALKIWRKVTKDMGIPLSVHYSGTWDNVAIEKHPEWACLQPDGKPYGQTFTFNSSIVCHNSEYIDKLLIPMFMELIDNYDLDGFWVDGDCWASKPCYCAICKRLFTDKTGIKDYPVKPGEPHWGEWMEFQRDSFFKYVKKYCDAVHAKKPTCLVCSNWAYTVRIPDEVSVPVDYLSGDFPFSFGLEITGLEARFMDSRRMTWDLMAWSFYHPQNVAWESPWTMKPLPHLQQEAAIVLANGGNLFIYNQPQRNGHLVGWHQDLLAEVAKFARQRQAISQHTVSVPQVALLHSRHHYYAHNEPLFNFSDAVKPLEGALQALLENHYHVDVLNEETLLKRIQEYRFVVVPEQTNLPQSLIDKLNEYVYNGGRLLVTGSFAAKDFEKILGIERVNEPKEGTFYLPADGGVVPIRGPIQFVRLTSARSLSPLFNGQEIKSNILDSPAATLASYGKGMIAAVYAPLFGFFDSQHYPRIRSFAGEVFHAVAGKQMVELEAPPYIDMTIRKKENKLIVHLLNRGTTFPLSQSNGGGVEGIPPVGPISMHIELQNKPARVSLAPDPEGLQWEWKNNILEVKISSLKIHNAVVIE